jgi:lipoprotein signal peptidase
MTRARHAMLGLLVALVVLAADQASKAWVLHIDLAETGPIVLLPVLDLTFVWNRGVTFGLLTGLGGGGGQWGHLILAAIACVVVIALVLWLLRAESRLVATAIGAITGGAIGNIADRLRYGAVVDFIHAVSRRLCWTGCGRAARAARPRRIDPVALTPRRMDPVALRSCLWRVAVLSLRP